MKKVLIMILLISILVITGCSSAKKDAFAQCLTENNVTMYGAFWCPHCANQKAQFGSSFKYATYVECSLPDRSGQTEICRKAVIESYPTWEFNDGSRLLGEQ